MKNHEAVSGALELAAAIKIWERLVERSLHYTELLGDGDTKAFDGVEKRVYGDKEKKKHRAYIMLVKEWEHR